MRIEPLGLIIGTAGLAASILAWRFPRKPPKCPHCGK